MMNPEQLKGITDTPEDIADRKAKFRSRAKWCNRVGVSLGLLIITPIAVMLLDRRSPIVLEDGVITPDPAIPGDTVSITWTTIERRACDGEFSRRIVEGQPSGKIHEFARGPTVYHRLSKGTDGQRKTFTRSFTLPESVTPGVVTYTVHGTRWCNVLQKYIWPIPFDGPKVKFTVQAKPLPSRLNLRRYQNGL